MSSILSREYLPSSFQLPAAQDLKAGVNPRHNLTPILIDVEEFPSSAAPFSLSSRVSRSYSKSLSYSTSASSSAGSSRATSPTLVQHSKVEASFRHNLSPLLTDDDETPILSISPSISRGVRSSPLFFDELPSRQTVKMPPPVPSAISKPSHSASSVPLPADYKSLWDKYSVKVIPKTKDYTVEEQEDVDLEIAGLWIEQHEEEYHEALLALVSKVKRISFSEFITTLRASIESFNRESSVWKDLTYTVLVQSGKSNQWVAELAMAYLSIKPECFLDLGIKDAKAFISYLDELETLNKRNKRIQYPEKIVLFDDGSYSGKQMCDHVNALFSKFFSLKEHASVKIPTCYIVIPFMTKYAEEKLEELAKRYKHVFIAAHVIIPSVEDAIGDKTLSDRLNELFWKNFERDGSAATRGIYYFDHKIPNSVSFVEALSTGSIHYSSGSTSSSKVMEGESKAVRSPPEIRRALSATETSSASVRGRKAVRGGLKGESRSRASSVVESPRILKEPRRRANSVSTPRNGNETAAASSQYHYDKKEVYIPIRPFVPPYKIDSD
jgi:hypothetical protein